MTRVVEFLIVPARTAPSVCKSAKCRARIFWIETAKLRNGKPVDGETVRIPVDCAVVGGVQPDDTHSGYGVNHFTTCNAAREF